MIYTKAKKFWAGVCICSLLFTGTNQYAMTVLAAEDEVVEAVSVDETQEVSVEIIANASELCAEGTIDGDDICSVTDSEGTMYYGTFNKTKGILTFCAEVLGVDEQSFMYEEDSDTWFDEIKVIEFETGSQLKSVGSRSFKGLPNLQKVDFSNCEIMSEINVYAFDGCTKLVEVEFPDSLQKIHAYAFNNCKELTTITLTPGLIELGGNAFGNCTKLSTVVIESGNITCKNGIFSNCTLDHIQFGGGNTILPDNLFNGATFKENAEIVIPYYVQKISDSAFQNSKNLTAVTFEDTVDNPSQLESIGKKAFYNCNQLETVTFPDSVKVIEASAFENCKALTKLLIPNTVIALGNSAFKGCEEITELTISNAISTLGTAVFENCSGLQSVVIPSGLTVLSDNMFRRCTALSSVTIPATVKTIGKSAFENCSELPTIVLPDTVESVGIAAFKGCGKLNNPTMPKDLEVYPASLFENCGKLGTISTSEKAGAPGELVIPDAVKTIGSYAFEDCDGIRMLTISKNVEKIDGGAFQNNTYIDTVTFETLDITCGTKIFTGSLLMNVVFPKGATEIPANLFSYGGFNAGRTVTIPATVTKIGNNAFGGDANTINEITKIVFEDNSELTTIGDRAFTYCTALETFHMPKTVTSIGAYAFKNDAALEEIMLPYSVTEIGNDAFKGCTNAKFLVIPGSYAENWLKSNGFTSQIDTTGVSIITYVLDGGENDVRNIGGYRAGDEFTFFEATRPGYIFDGWYLDAEFTNRVYDLTGRSGDFTLYAKWKEGNYTITYELDGGENHPDNPANYTYYDAFKFQNPTREGYVFRGWYLDKEWKVGIKEIKEGSWGNLTLYARWVPDKKETNSWGDIVPEDCALFKDASEVPEGIWVAGVKDTEYTGKAIKFDVRVYSHKKLLTLKKDYTIQYSNNKKVASSTDKKAPTVTINGKGNYKGKQLVKFNILPRDISGEEFEADDIWTAVTGKVQKPVPVITWGKTKLKNKKDFTIDSASASGYSEAGIYTVTMTGIGNYCGTRTLTFTLTNTLLMSKAKIAGVKAVSYTGNEITLPVSVMHSGNILIEGIDYDIEYLNNVEVGTATVVITGKGNYAGVKKVDFKINPVATINKASFHFSPVTYTGQAFTLDGEDLKVSVDYKGTPMTEGKDYEVVSYSNNTAAGKGTVVFKGVNAYSGTVKKTFKIDAANVANLKLNFIDEKGEITDGLYGYCKGGVKPSVYLEYEGKTLKAGTDYTLSYKNNKKIGTGTIVVKGKKNFKGTLTGSFTISTQDIGKLRISIPDIPYQETANIYASKPVIYDLDGKKLSAGKDYSSDIVYTYAVDCYVKQGNAEVFREGGTVVDAKDILPVGTMIKATVSGAGNYTGQMEGVYRIVKGTISNAKVTVVSQEYTGSEVQPDKSQITVMVGDTKLEATDYEIVGYSKNISTGTATITLRGVGDYGGTITAKFKIYQKNFIISQIMSLFGY